MHARELDQARAEAQAALEAAEAARQAGEGHPEGEGPPTSRLGRLAGAVASRRPKFSAGQSGSPGAAEGRAARAAWRVE
jgi:hypothetical protein